jgi:hypothetical protein
VSRKSFSISDVMPPPLLFAGPLVSDLIWPALTRRGSTLVSLLACEAIPFGRAAVLAEEAALRAAADALLETVDAPRPIPEAVARTALVAPWLATRMTCMVACMATLAVCITGAAIA